MARLSSKGKLNHTCSSATVLNLRYQLTTSKQMVSGKWRMALFMGSNACKNKLAAIKVPKYARTKVLEVHFPQIFDKQIILKYTFSVTNAQFDHISSFYRDP